MTEEPFVFHLERPRQNFSVVEAAMAVARANGRSPFGQAADLLRLRRGPGKLDADEYYAFRLWDRTRFSPAEAAAFAGRARQQEDAALVNDPSWYALGQDKLAAGAVLEGLGLPVPPILAILHESRGGPSLPALRDRESLARHLREEIAYPFFGKPIGGSYSVGVLGVEAYEADGDRLRLANGRHIALTDYVERLFEAYEQKTRYNVDGFVFQALLRPHPELAAITGSATLPTIRVVLLIDEGEASLFRACWKIPAGENQADNFWRKGNLLAPIDVTTGQVGEALRGTGLEQERLSHHPDTGAAIAGAVLPDWAELIYLAREATSAFPGMQMQGWDIALTDRGPRLIEVNGVGDYNLPQIAYGRGLLDRDFLAFLQRCRARKNRKVPPLPQVARGTVQ
jgi:hypothetical protein